MDCSAAAVPRTVYSIRAGPDSIHWFWFAFSGKRALGLGAAARTARCRTFCCCAGAGVSDSPDLKVCPMAHFKV